MNWTNIKECPNYQISDSGVVRRVSSQKTRKLLKTATGYLTVRLPGVGGTKNRVVHRLVAKEFVPNPLCLRFVNHKNGVKTDNRADNLEWVTAKENILHSYAVLGNTGPRKKVAQYDLNGILLETYRSVADAVKGTQMDYSTVAGVAKGKKGYDQAYGFVWKYYESEPAPKIIPRLHKRAKAVIGTSEEETVSFSSVSKAAKSLGINHSGIFNCLSGKTKTAGGFRWEYK